MRLIKMLSDRRNPIFFGHALKKPEKNSHDEIYFSFTLDLEHDINNEFDEKQFNKIVELISEFGQGTFFVDTKLLESHDLDFKGHEIASHGYDHSALGKDWWIKKSDMKLKPAESIAKSTSIIRKKYKRQPVSFRAPKFSIGRNTLQMLKENGYLIDSSASPHSPGLLPYEKQGILEVPLSRSTRPKFRLFPLPHLEYPSLMFSILKKTGLDYFSELTDGIVSCWNEKPLLVFMCHNWDFQSQKDYDLLRGYLKELKGKYKTEFISLQEYHKIISLNT